MISRRQRIRAGNSLDVPITSLLAAEANFHEFPPAFVNEIFNLRGQAGLSHLTQIPENS